MQPLSGLGAVASDYDGAILDLWGCVHDGLRPYPQALDAMARLRDAGKRIVLLSNAPRRVDAVIAQLRGLGVPDDAYDGVMSSGEATWRRMADAADPWHGALGRRCLHVGPDRDHGMLDGAGLTVVADPREADFLLVTGPYSGEDTVETSDALLAAAQARGLPLVCANPDRVVMRGERMEICAGSIAERYAARGGAVRWYGKPDPAIYEDCFTLLGMRSRILAVGDSLSTDIKGANAAGVDSLLLTQGIHAAELAQPDGAPAMGKVAAAAQRIGAWPDYVAA
ncbi:MAG: TIGR01459 family HAD-type hydrolase, partial [Alphaproteobacteria bacterium]